MFSYQRRVRISIYINQINVTDSLTDTGMRRATTIVSIPPIVTSEQILKTLSFQHWHGLFQSGTNEMDGVAWVTQCPIIPDESFL